MARSTATGSPHPASTHATTPPRAVIRALLFESDRSSEAIPADALARMPPPADTQLLWLDVTSHGQPFELPRGLDLDVARLDVNGGFEPGVVLDGAWKFLQVQALNWHGQSHPVRAPLAVAVGPNVVITAHREPIGFLQAVLDDEADHLRVGQLESMIFAASLLDRMLTDYLDARDEFETVLDRLELLILRKPQPRYLRELQHLRRLASKLRQHLADQRDLFDALARPDFDPGQSDLAGRNCRLLSARYSRVMSAIETARELVNGSFDLYTSRVAESTNQVVYTLTAATLVIGVLATVAGVMGMNFTAELFESGDSGFAMTVAGMVALVLGAVAWMLWERRRTRRATMRPRAPGGERRG
jgi:Mg2+ and Co2+ transporter CorA